MDLKKHVDHLNMFRQVTKFILVTCLKWYLIMNTSSPKTLLMEAAAEIYASGQIYSVRRIASLAGVNHGQVHHLFGGKEGLTQAMFTHLGMSLLERLAHLDPLNAPEAYAQRATEALLKDRRFVRALARKLTETNQVPQEEFPFIEMLLRVNATMPPDIQKQAKRLLTQSIAQALGWALFEPWLKKALDLNEEDTAQIETQLGQIPPEALQWLMNTTNS